MYHLVWVTFPWQYGLRTRVFSLIWECGIILHVWGILLHHHTCVFPWRRRSAFLLAMAVWVLEPNTAVVSPTSIPLREVLVLPDAETHITHRQQQHTPSHAQIINTKCTAYACVICQKLFYSDRIEMYCTCYQYRTQCMFAGYRIRFSSSCVCVFVVRYSREEC